MQSFFRAIKGRTARVRIAWTLLILSLIGWPISVWITDEPVFILSLSWFAITITAWDVICTSELHDDE